MRYRYFVSYIVSGKISETITSCTLDLESKIVSGNDVNKLIEILKAHYVDEHTNEDESKVYIAIINFIFLKKVKE